ncbi:unnamed protein product [Microthlaspi erraticum]|uniref:Uncharacterized protein n=1 Tax=Microthlaspi erraticum TaxID=1685480 RepID=A0A6D2JC34_9BRAS|nr:unnamed protein product [Microthlaspi erraticum]
MDFIKTSSLRALIELTFQRNWNGLIWMSRKGVITKRVKTVQTALSRISAQPRSPAGRGNYVSARPNSSVRLKSRPKSKPFGRPRNTTRETLSRGRPSSKLHAARARPCRASRGTRPRGRATVPRHDRCIRPSRERTSHVWPRNHRPNHRPPTSRPTVNPSGPDRSDRPRPDCPADRPDDRPNAAVDPSPF